MQGRDGGRGGGGGDGQCQRIKTQHFSVRCRDVLTTARQHGRIVAAIKAVDVRYSSKGRPDSEDRKGPIIRYEKPDTHAT